jgi:iron transport multicopper oxidase
LYYNPNRDAWNSSWPSDATLYGPNSNAFVLPVLSVVELTVTNTDAGKHPFHLHGHKFSILNQITDFISQSL